MCARIRNFSIFMFASLFNFASSELVGPVATVCAGGGDPTLRLIEKKVARESERWKKIQFICDVTTTRAAAAKCVRKKRSNFFLYVSFSDIISSFSCELFLCFSQIDLRYCAAPALMRWKVPKNEKWRQQSRRCVVGRAHDCLIKATIESAERREDFFLREWQLVLTIGSR